MICVNSRLTPSSISCAQRGSHELAAKLKEHILNEKLAIAVVQLPCFGRCEDGPVMRLAPGGEFLSGMDVEQIMVKVRAFAASSTRQT